MVGITEISATIGGIKAAMDIAKGISATSDAIALAEVKIALQTALLDAQGNLISIQDSQSKNLRRIEELEAQILKFDAWAEERARYKLVEFPSGTHAYVLKEEQARGEPIHRICPSCYQESRKSILQTVWKRDGGEEVSCPKCKMTMKLSLPVSRQIKYDRDQF